MAGDVGMLWEFMRLIDDIIYGGNMDQLLIGIGTLTAVTKVCIGHEIMNYRWLI